MNEVSAVLLAALVGALAGLGGGGLAALASLRASQLVARAPLAASLHQLGVRLVLARAALGTSEEDGALRDVELQWNHFAVHQRILCPSERLERLSDVLRTEFSRADLTPDARLALAGQIVEKLSRIVGAHSSRLLRWQSTWI